MNSEIKICQSCKSAFTIELEDFDFYEKIKVPPPTWCPECRMIRRMAFWNERSFFKRINERGEVLLSEYPESAPLTIVDHDYWWSDDFDAAKYGRDYNFSKSFFEQFKELLITVPFQSRTGWEMINSEYSNNASHLKNCYMCFNSVECENCMYSVFCGFCKDCIDALNVGRSESCYELLSSGGNYEVHFSVRVNECRKSYFLYNCTNCSDCIGCVNLKHRQYHIFNEPYEKNEYFRKLREFDFGSYAGLTAFRNKFEDFILKFPHKYISGSGNVNVLGDDIDNSRNAIFCFETVDSENVRYSQALALKVKDSYDYTNWGANAGFIYESLECGNDVNSIKFCSGCSSGSRDLEYCMDCVSSENCFASIGLKKKKYCILNKQYSKDEYSKLREKIIEHMNDMPYMDKQGRVYKYGEFFPVDMTPFAANETALIDFTDIDKRSLGKFGLTWREPRESEHKTTIKAKDLPDHIKDAENSITKEIIGCIGCGLAYRIIPQELEFYKRFKTPLPRLCHNCRFKERIKHRNIPEWFERRCNCNGAKSKNGVYANISNHFHKEMPCPNNFTTAYNPKKNDIVYCEECYQKETV